MNRPTLIVIGGFAGAGKTTLVSKLAGQYNYAVLSADSINDALRHALNKTYREMSPVGYKVMWHLARQQLKLGVTVIVDVHMSAAHMWESLDELKKDFPEVHILPIILQATLENHRARIEQRGLTQKEHLNLGGDKLEDVLHKYEYIESLNRHDLIRVDANGSRDDVYTAVEKVLRDHGV